MDIKPTTGEFNNDINRKFTIIKAINNTDVGFNISRLVELSSVINDENVELNVSEISRAN